MVSAKPVTLFFNCACLSPDRSSRIIERIPICIKLFLQVAYLTSLAFLVQLRTFPATAGVLSKIIPLLLTSLYSPAFV